MVKEFYCKSIKDNKVCGKTNKDAFEEGRYTSCKECRKLKNCEYNKNKFKSLKEEKMNDLNEEERIEIQYKETRIRREFEEDLELRILELIEETLATRPILNKRTIYVNIENLESIVDDIVLTQNDIKLYFDRKYNILTEKMDKLILENVELKESIQILKNDLRI